MYQHFPHLNFVVEDISDDQLSTAQLTDVKDRVSLQKYDYFETQPIRDAGVYIFRNTFHNHNDEDCVKMLQALLPALEGRPDAILLINEVIVPERADVGITRAEENQLRQLDLMMMSLFGAKERSRKDWLAMLKRVDERFEVIETHYNPNGAGITQVRLRK